MRKLLKINFNGVDHKEARYKKKKKKKFSQLFPSLSYKNEHELEMERKYSEVTEKRNAGLADEAEELLKVSFDENSRNFLLYLGFVEYSYFCEKKQGGCD